MSLQRLVDNGAMSKVDTTTAKLAPKLGETMSAQQAGVEAETVAALRKRLERRMARFRRRSGQKGAKATKGLDRSSSLIYAHLVSGGNGTKLWFDPGHGASPLWMSWNKRPPFPPPANRRCSAATTTS